MGELIQYDCKKCGYSFKTALGFGFSYPSAFQGVVNAARKGQLGKEYRRKILFQVEVLGRMAAIDLTHVIARCEDCGNYQTIVDETLYAVPKKYYPGDRIWTGSNKEFFITPEEMKRHGIVVGEKEHRCGLCNGRLKAIEGVPEELACPECGSMMRKELAELFD